MKIWSASVGLLAKVFHAVDPRDTDCASLCPLVGGCGNVTTACVDDKCSNMYKYGDGICLDTGDGTCDKSTPLACDAAIRLNPDRACGALLPGSYCKLNHVNDARVCQGLGTDSSGNACVIGTDGCDPSKPYSCDDAIVALNKSA
jgi:hypothetical protein